MEKDKSVISIANLSDYMTHARIKALLDECIRQQHNRIYYKNDRKHRVNLTDIIDGNQSLYDESASVAQNQIHQEWTHDNSCDTSSLISNTSSSMLGIRYSQLAKRQDDIIDKLPEMFSSRLTSPVIGKCAIQNWLGSMLFSTLHPYTVARFSTLWMSSMMHVYHAPFDNRYVGTRESLSHYYPLKDQSSSRMNTRMLFMGIANSNQAVHSIIQYVISGDACVNVPTRAALYSANMATHYNNTDDMTDEDKAANQLFINDISTYTDPFVSKLKEEAMKIIDEMVSSKNPRYVGSHNRVNMSWVVTTNPNRIDEVNRYYIHGHIADRYSKGCIVNHCHMMKVLDRWEGLLDWLQEMPAQEIREISVFWTGDNMDNRLNIDTRVSLKRGLIAKPYFVYNSIVNQGHTVSTENSDALATTL